MHRTVRFCILSGLFLALVECNPTRTTVQPSTTTVTAAPPAAAAAAGACAAVDLGTTLVAIRYKDGVVVAADSRTSVGSSYVSNRYAVKLAPLTRHCLVLRSGSAADTQQVAQACRHAFYERSLRYGNYHHHQQHQQQQPTVRQMAHWLSQAVRDNPDGQASLLVAGYDNNNSNNNNDQNGPHIYSIALSGALQEEDDFAAAGSGSTFILGFLDHELGTWRRQGNHVNNNNNNQPFMSITESQAVDLCQRAIGLAAQRDGSSGGLVRLCIIDQHGIRSVTARPVVNVALAVPDDKNPQHPKQSTALPGFAASIP